MMANQPGVEEEMDPALERRICEALDDSVRAYDADTRHALREARQQAAGAVRTHGLMQFRNWVLGSMIAAPAVLAVLLMVSPGEAPVPLEPVSVEMLAMAEEVEFYGDLEFYEWLANEQL